MFDVELPECTVIESANTKAGYEIVTFDTEFCRMGLGICYDIRFPEIAHIMAREGAELLLYPSAYLLLSGKKHLEIMCKARALDNQVFLATAGQSLNPHPKAFATWGHSQVISPDGDILGSCTFEEGLVVADIDLNLVDKQRSEFPIESQKRNDIYELIYKKGNKSEYSNTQSKTMTKDNFQIDQAQGSLPRQKAYRKNPFDLRVGYPLFQQTIIVNTTENCIYQCKVIDIGYPEYQQIFKPKQD